jgi:mono/diheme cytochrome c family protein
MSDITRLGVGCLWVAALIGSLATGAAAPQKAVPRVESQHYAAIVSLAGKDNFNTYCAVCHGRDGKGNGPAAPAMKAAVPDLTTLARRHGGTFNAPAVEYVIRGTGRMPTPAHGVEQMPIWGYVFDPTMSERGAATLRINNLVKYLESIQEGGVPISR